MAKTWAFLRFQILQTRYRLFGLPVMRSETFKARARRIREGFFEAYCKGGGLDICDGGDLLTENCKGWEWFHGDAQYLKGLKDHTFDFVYSSHALEHMEDPAIALKSWWRVLKPGGYLLLYLPHRDLYEKRTALPSRWNPDHKHFFLPYEDEPPDTKGVVPLIRQALLDAEIIEVKICDEGHAITDPEIHSDGEYSIEVITRKPN